MKLFFQIGTYTLVSLKSFEFYLGIPFWNQGAFLSSASSKILLVDSCWLYMFEDIKGGGVVAELFVLASPELNPEDPFRLLLHPEGKEKKSLSFWEKNSWNWNIYLDWQWDQHYSCQIAVLENQHSNDQVYDWHLSSRKYCIVP